MRAPATRRAEGGLATHGGSRSAPVVPRVTSWVGGALIGIANGVAREATYGERIPEHTAHQLSGLTSIGGFAAYFWLLQRPWPIPSSRSASKIGGAWLVLTVTFEFGFGRLVAKQPWDELRADYDVPEGRTWPLVLAWIAVGPAVGRRVQGRHGELCPVPARTAVGGQAPDPGDRRPIHRAEGARLERMFPDAAASGNPSGGTDRMVRLGHGHFARADRIFALVPIEGPVRGDGARTYVHVDGLSEPLIASRSERAILADMKHALDDRVPERGHRRRFRRQRSTVTS
jgi:hypothetical protein